MVLKKVYLPKYKTFVRKTFKAVSRLPIHHLPVHLRLKVFSSVNRVQQVKFKHRV